MPSWSTEVRTWSIRHGPPPPAPDSGVVHGVSLGPEGGAVVTSELRGEHRTATKLRRFDSGLEPIAARVRELLARDPGCRVVLDRGLRGRELADAIGPVQPRRRLQLFDARLEDRRYEIGGRLSHAIEARTVRITRNLLAAPALHRAVSEASREDAGERPELVALSLALIDRRPPMPRIG